MGSSKVPTFCIFPCLGFVAFHPHFDLKVQADTMRIAVLTILFTVAVSASPHAWAAPAASLAPTASSAPGHKRNRTRHHHKEPTPVFELPCNCQKPVVPVNLLSANEKCLMDHAANLACYISSKGGCPSPAPACGLSAKNIIPLHARDG
ncbi:hypothetical protein ACN47E_008829 [Coniothyrium glycines]